MILKLHRGGGHTKGFTLVELLAVIVILALLVIIAVPSVIKMLNSTKKNAFSVEAENIIKSAKNAYSARELNNETKKMCYTLSELSEYVDKDFTDYDGSVYIDPSTNTYKIWLSKDELIINGSNSGEIEIVELSGVQPASTTCEDIEIVACTNNKHILAVLANNGSFEDETSYKKYELLENATQVVEEPTREGYTFDSWLVNGTPASFEDGVLRMGEDDVFLIAQWGSLSKTLTIVLNGGIIERSSTEDVLPGRTTNIPNPTKANYIFDGWIVSGEGSSLEDGLFTMGSEDAIITAKWANAYSEPILNGAYPRLDAGMIPVNISTTGVVTKADKFSSEWYSYTNRKWANAVLVNNGSRARYQNAEVGSPITSSDILAYFVWIPRYKYKMFNVDGTALGASYPATHAIEIVFESKNTPTSDGKKDGVYTNGEYLTHPAFTFGNEPLNGLWVGKFETTPTPGSECATTPSISNCLDENPTILPGIRSLTFQNVSTQFLTSLKFGGGSYNTVNDTYTYSGPNDYGLTHISRMAQNNDWGAIGYLAYSIYGRCTSLSSCTEISRNNNSLLLTGYSEVNKATTGYSDTSIATNEFGTSASITKPWTDQTYGVKASTTGNIYGIYDMSGGAFEYTMSVLNNYSGMCDYYNSGFNGTFGDTDGHANCNASILSKNDGIDFPESKYYTTYTTTNYQTACNGLPCYGSALKETYGWFTTYNATISSKAPWNGRGGYVSYGTTAGLSGLNSTDGNSYIHHTFRTVIGL